MADPVQPPPHWSEIESLPEFQAANRNTKLNALAKWKIDTERFLFEEPETYKTAKPELDKLFHEREAEINAPYELSTGEGMGAAVIAAAHDFPLRTAAMGESINLIGAKLADNLLGTNLEEGSLARLKGIQSKLLTSEVPPEEAAQLTYQLTGGALDLIPQMSAALMSAGAFGAGPSTTVAGELIPASARGASAALNTSAAIGAAQSGLQTYAERQDVAASLNAAAITGLVTKAMGNTGIESVFKEGGLSGVRSKVVDFLKQNNLEGMEEFADQLLQGFAQKATTNPDKPLSDIWNESKAAYIVGFGVSGLAKTPGMFAGEEAVESPKEVTPNDFLPQELQSPQPTVAEIADEAGISIPQETEEATTNEQIIPETEPAQQVQAEADGQGAIPSDVGISTPETTTSQSGVTPFNVEEAPIEQVPSPEQAEPQADIQEAEPVAEGAATLEVAPEETRITENMDLVERAVSKTMAKFPQADEAEVRSMAMDALQGASKRFDPKLNNNFRAYATNLLNRRLSRPVSQKQQTIREATVSAETPVSEDTTLGQVLPDEGVIAPDEEVMKQERATAGEFIRAQSAAFQETLNPRERVLWDKIHSEEQPGKRISDKDIEKLGAKFRTYLVKQGMRGLESSRATAPEGWTPNSREVQNQLRQAHDLSSVGSMLKSIGSKSQNPAYRELSKVLARKNTKGITLKLQSDGKYRNSDGQYGWEKGKPTLVLNMDNITDVGTLERVALHEAIHAFTLDLIDLYEANPRLLTSKQRSSIETMQKILDKARTHIIGDKATVDNFLRLSIKDPVTASQETDIPYGLTSLAEFATESLSQPEFQRMLKQIPFESRKGPNTLWAAFIEAIKNLFNAPKGSALEAATSSIADLIDMHSGPSRAEGSASSAPLAPSAAPSLKRAAEFIGDKMHAKGKFNDPVFKALQQRDQTAAESIKRADFAVRELRRATKEAKFKDTDTISRALNGDVEALLSLPARIANAVGVMRTSVDSLSQKLLDSGILSKELTATVGDNMGVYLNRSYEIFDNPNFKSEQRENEPVMQQARQYLRKYIAADYATGYATEKGFQDVAMKQKYGFETASLDDPLWTSFLESEDYANLVLEGAQKAIDEQVASDVEVEREIERLLDIANREEGGQGGLGGVPGRKNLNILKRRKDIPQEIRELWGEYNDPYVNYVRTMSKMGNMIAQHKFASTVASQGLAEGWLYRSDDPNRPPQTVPLVTDNEQDRHYRPLSGIYGDEKLREAFQEYAQRDNNSAWVRIFTGLTGLAMASKTVGSIQAISRNFQSNVLIAMNAGHITGGSLLSGENFKGARNALRSVEANLISATKDSKEWEERFLKYQSLGLVGDGVDAGVMREMVRRASQKDENATIAENMADDILSGTKRAIGTLPKFYQSMDDFWKIHGFEVERWKYRKAFPEMPDGELDALAASHIRDIYPTYSLAPVAVKELKRIPFVAPFITFTTEIIRTTANNAILASQEIKDPRTRSIGIERFAGMAAAQSVLLAAGYTLQSLLGFDDEDMDSLRELVPDWQKDSQLIPLKKQDGKIQYLDAGYLDPYQYFKDPFRAIMRSQGAVETIANVAKNVIGPFVNEQLLFGSVVDVLRNKTSSGRKIYEEQLPWPQWAAPIAAHMWQTFEPGTITSGRRIAKAAEGFKESSGRSYSLWGEILSPILGQRISETDAMQAIGQKTRGYKKNNADASSIFTRTINNRGTIRPGDVTAAYLQANDAKYQLTLSMRRAYEAALKIGATEEQIRSSWRSEEVSQQIINQILSGVYRPYVASPDILREAAQKDEARVSEYNAARAMVTEKSLLKGQKLPESKTVPQSPQIEP